MKNKIEEFRRQSNMFHKQWETFHRMMIYFKTGKTGIYIHPDFVMIDHETWKKLQKKAKPKQIIFYDEASDLVPQAQEEK